MLNLSRNEKRRQAMNSDLLTRWTAIITNVAVLAGLVFVGLEFRNNTRAIEAERIERLVEGIAEVNSHNLGNREFAELLYRAYQDPGSLEGSDLDRVQHLMIAMYQQFQSVHLAHQAGLIPDEIYEIQKAGIGFGFSSDVGFDLIEIMRGSNLRESLWDVVEVSAEQARDHCLAPQNRCVARYESARTASD
jgi:hypothetical protein